MPNMPDGGTSSAGRLLCYNEKVPVSFKESDMAKKMIEIGSMKLAHTKNGTISVAHIEQPYGEHSSPVVSIAIALEGDDSDWKVHIPYENLEEVIKALYAAKDVSEGLPHKDPHTMDLGGDIGGGA